MVMRARVRHPEAHRYFIQKQDARCPLRPLVIARAEDQFILPFGQRLARQQRGIGAPVGIGHSLGDLAVAVSADAHPERSFAKILINSGARTA